MALGLTVQKAVVKQLLASLVYSYGIFPSIELCLLLKRSSCCQANATVTSLPSHVQGRCKPTGINQTGLGAARQVNPRLRTETAVRVRETGVH